MQCQRSGWWEDEQIRNLNNSHFFPLTDTAASASAILLQRHTGSGQKLGAVVCSRSYCQAAPLRSVGKATIRQHCRPPSPSKPYPTLQCHSPHCQHLYLPGVRPHHKSLHGLLLSTWPTVTTGICYNHNTAVGLQETQSLSKQNTHTHPGTFISQ